MKTCNKCGEYKLLPAFSRDKHKKDGYSTVCKDCKSQYRKAYYSHNQEKAREDARKWYESNKEKSQAASKAWVRRNRERYLQYRKRVFQEKYYGEDGFRISCCVRSCLRRTLQATDKPKDFITFQKLGYTAHDLKRRIEMNLQSGMFWGNHGEWEIDHRVPLSRMIERGETRVEILNCLANLRPVWREENRSKGARYAS